MSREGAGHAALTDGTFLPALLAGHPQLANIGVLSPDGAVLASAYPLSSRRSSPVFEAALRSRGVVTGSYALSPIFERPTLNHALAVRAPDGAVSLVLFTGLDLGWLSSLARQSSLGEDFSLLITDRGGTVLAGADANNAEVERLRGAAIPDLREIARTGHGRLMEIAGTDVRRYFMALPLEETDPNSLYAMAGLPYENVLRQTGSAFFRTLAALGLLTLFTIRERGSS